MSTEKKLNVQLINSNCDYDGKIYAAIAFNGGFAARRFWIGEEQPFKGSYAFFNMLSYYIKELYPENIAEVTLLPSSTTLSLGVEKQRFVDALNKTLAILLELPMERETYDLAYSKMRKNYVQIYKNSSFRANLRALEFVSFNKGFERSELNKDMDEMTFDFFKECAEKLLVAENMRITVVGNFAGDFEKISQEINIPSLLKEEYLLTAYEREPFERTDVHIKEAGSDTVISAGLSFTFLSPMADNTTRYLLFNILKERLDRENTMVVFDNHDVGLITDTDSFNSLRAELSKAFDEQEFEKLKEKIKNDIFVLLSNYPQEYCELAASMQLSYVDLMELPGYLEACTYAQYDSIFKAADVVIRECQVFITRGGM